MKSKLRDKVNDTLTSPCRVTDDCLDDYDPCGSSDDITEKDLAVLLKEETAKLKQENQDKQEKKEQEVTETEEEEGKLGSQAVKKKPCRKLPIKNPFFTNRLTFSNDLPPPPSSPPPQFFPPVEEVDSKPKVCPKAKIKCKKKKDEEGVKKPETKEKAMKEEAAEGQEDKKEGGETGGGREGEEEEEEECIKEYARKKKKRKPKEPCKKKPEKPLCKKKVSEVSISLLPPQIPPLQRDLPPTSPKEIPEVERQILMACGSSEKKCQKKTTKCKPKVKK